MIYLNNAATSFPKPEIVIEAVNNQITSFPYNSSRTGIEQETGNFIDECRNNIACLFEIKNPLNIILTSGATESLNLAINGLELEGKHVITSAIEHNSVIRPLKRLEAEGIIELDFIGCDKTGFVDPGDIKLSIKPNTEVIVLNHCSNVTGRIQDLKAVSEIAQENGIILIVDASQSAGAVPISLQECHIDMLAFTGHKSLMGISGCGGLYIDENLSLRPLKVGGTGIHSDNLFQPEKVPLYYEAGTPNLAGIASLKAGTEFVLETGIDKIKTKKNILMKKLLTNLTVHDDLIFYRSENYQDSAGLCCLNIKGVPSWETAYILYNSFGIITRSGLHCAPLIHKALNSYPDGSVRISLSYFTTTEEIDYLLESIEQIVRVKAGV